MRIYRRLIEWVRCCEGATAIEYGLMLAGISLTIAFSVFLFSDQLIAVYEAMGTASARIAVKAETAGD